MKQPIDITALQNEHLDTMIKLAFELDDNLEIQRILSTPDPTLSAEEVASADRAFDRAIASSEKDRKHKDRVRLIKIARQIVPRVIEIAACLVLIAAFATPIALANSATFRAKIMQLLVEWDTEKGEAHFQFTENKEATFWVPEGWIGSHFPSLIPDGFQIFDFDPFFTMIEYRNANDDQLFFCEYDANTNLLAGTENAIISSIHINGYPGYLIEGKGADGITEAITVVWSNDINWFSVTSFGLTSNEALLVATSVKKVIE